MDTLSQQQIQEFKNAFDLFDKDKDGEVSREDLENTLKSLSISKSGGEVKEMINECDPARRGKISFTDFMTTLSTKLRNTDAEEAIRDGFLSFDTEKKGYISASELKTALTTTGDKLTDEEARLLLKEAKCHNEHGLFDYEEFIAAIFMKEKTAKK